MNMNFKILGIKKKLRVGDGSKNQSNDMNK